MANKSGFAMKFRFRLDDAPEVEVATGISEVLRFEKVLNKGFGSSDKISDMVWISWSGAVRQKLITQYTAKFDQFSDHLTDWEILEGNDDPEADESSETEADPTQPDPQPES